MSLTMGGESSRVFRGLKLVKVVRMVRLLRLFRVLKTARFQLLTEEVLEVRNTLSSFKWCYPDNLPLSCHVPHHPLYL